MSRKRLLIIDGDETFAREVAEVADSRGFDTTACATSVEGLELATSLQPDLVVVNVELAPTNGWSVCIKLKKDEALQHIPVVLTSSTSTADTFEKHRKLRTRADEYLLKPYTPNQLIDLAGSLVGLPEVDEPLVEVHDAPAFDAEYEFQGDDGFAFAEDEPIEEVEFESADGFAALGDESDATVDALPESDEWGHDPLGDPLADPLGDSLSLGGEEEVAFDEDVEPLPEPPAEALDDFSRGEFATSEFSAGALAAATAALRAEAAQQQQAAQPQEASGEPLAEEPWGEDEIDPLAAFDDDSDFTEDLEEFGEAPFDEEAGAAEAAFVEESFEEESFAEESFSEEDFPEAPLEDAGYDEAPLEVPGVQGDDVEEALIEELGSALDDGDFDLGDEVGLAGGALAGAELARLDELEAQLEGYRAADAARTEELERLRADLAARDQELIELRGQVELKDREVREVSAKHTTDVSRAAAEKARREATIKSLTARGEQLTALTRKAERELSSTREAAAKVPPLEARVSELEGLLETSRQQAQETDSLRAQVTSLQADLSRATEQHEAAAAEQQAARAEADGLRNDLDEARRTAERALENAGKLQEKLAEANERAEAAEQRVQALEQANSKARDALLKMVEGLGTA